MNIHHSYWLPAFGVAALVHLGLAAAMFWQWSTPGALEVGTGGIEVALGPAGGGPPAAGAAVQEAPETAALEEPTPVPEEVPAMPEPPPEAPTMDPVEPVEAEAVEEPLTEPEPEPVVVKKPPPTPEPEPRAEPPPEPVAVAAATPQPTPEAVPEPSPPAASRDTPGKVATAAPDPRGGGEGTRNAPDTGSGSGDDSAGGGMPGAQADYAAILQAWLERHKEYPRRAQRRRQEGTALLYFVMDREGHVLDYRIEESSGFGLLDREVERMIQRAQPLPRMPEDMQQARLELMVPVQFFLR